MLRGLAGVCFILCVSVFAYWGYEGAHFVTQYEVAVEKQIEDEFGDVETITEMQPEFQFGLMPDKILDGALSLGLLFAGMGVALFVGDVVRRKKAQSA